jgi:hypothetical protein
MKSFGSPPCFLHELASDSTDATGTEEIVAILNELLEAERAGAKLAARMSRDADDQRVDATLEAVAIDEARFCGMLCGLIEAFGVAPSRRTGDFYEKVMALDSLDARLKLLNRGQSWVVRKLNEVMPKINDEAIRKQLQGMLEVHERNIDQCERLSRPQ